MRWPRTLLEFANREISDVKMFRCWDSVYREKRMVKRNTTMLCIFRAALKLATYKWWFRKWWKLLINTNSVSDMWVLEKKLSIDAWLRSFTLLTVEKEPTVPLPDVLKWNELSTIRERAKENRPTFVDVQSARSWCRCAFIIRSFVVRLYVMFHFVGSWNESYKL